MRVDIEDIIEHEGEEYRVLDFVNENLVVACLAVTKFATLKTYEIPI